MPGHPHCTVCGSPAPVTDTGQIRRHFDFTNATWCANAPGDETTTATKHGWFRRRAQHPDAATVPSQRVDTLQS